MTRRRQCEDKGRGWSGTVINQDSRDDRSRQELEGKHEKDYLPRACREGVAPLPP